METGEPSGFRLPGRVELSFGAEAAVEGGGGPGYWWLGSHWWSLCESWNFIYKYLLAPHTGGVPCIPEMCVGAHLCASVCTCVFHSLEKVTGTCSITLCLNSFEAGSVPKPEVTLEDSHVTEGAVTEAAGLRSSHGARMQQARVFTLAQ